MKEFSDILYLDYQASTPVHSTVFDQMIPYFRDSFGNAHSNEHAYGWKSQKAVEESAEKVARLLGADSDEIIFTSGATEANNLALLGLATKKKRDRILVSSIEHKCVLTVAEVLGSKFGFRVEKLPVDRTGHVSFPNLESTMGDDVLLVSIMAVNNEIGTVQNIPALSEIIRKSGALFHCDAAQAPMAMTTTDLALYADLISLSGHKMYGPKGIGALYVRRDLQRELEPIIYGGGQQNGLRSGTVPTPLAVGLGAAAEIFQSENIDIMREKIRSHRDHFLSKITGLPWPTKLNGEYGENRHPGNANICFNGISAQDLLTVLQPRLAASSGSACTSGIPEPSHVLDAIGLGQEDASSSIRFSFGFETEETDIDRAIESINDALIRLSNISGSCDI